MTSGKKVGVAAAVIAAGIMSCDSGPQNITDPDFGTINLDYMQSDADPKNDFFNFCNGTWVANNPVPSTETSWGSFNELRDRNNKVLKSILEESSNGSHDAGSPSQLIGDYFYTYMDQEARDTSGLKPIEFLFNSIDNMAGVEEAVSIIAEHHDYQIPSFFGVSVMQDLGDNTRHMTYVAQSGLSLPSKDYYIDEKHTSLRDEYLQHAVNTFALMGYEEVDAHAAAATVLEIETSLAAVSRGPVELRDIQSRYNLMPMDSLVALAPDFAWGDYFAARGLNDLQEVIVTEPDFLVRFNEMLNTVPLDDVKTYLKWKVIDETAGTLSSDFDDEQFAFYGTTLGGAKEKKEQWERALSSITNSAIAEALGRAFVEKNFSPEAKAKVDEMVTNLMAAFEDRLDQLDWMSDSTKMLAREKLNSFSRKLGYPETWTDYSDLNITRESYVLNYLDQRAFDTRRNLEKIDQPIDKSEWDMPPHMVNAYYNPLNNEIVFPAGIMQPPFFDPNAEDAINYGRMGMVIGHEFTHGFDDQGSQFNKDGLLANWWSESDFEEFENRTAKLKDHFNEFEALDGVFVNGELTLGENIADLGGLTLSYYAYQKSLESKERVNVHGYTPEQRFFIGFGQLWKINYTDEALRRQVETNPHSPGQYRVIGPLANMPEFWEAFNVQEGDEMRRSPDKVAKIW